MNSFIKPVGYSAGFALLWGLLAWNSPSTTYHLAPLIVAAAVPGALLLGDEKVPISQLILAGGAGGMLALIATVLLGSSDHLLGGSLLPFGGAVAEALVFTGAGAVVATALATITSSRRP